MAKLDQPNYTQIPNDLLGNILTGNVVSPGIMAELEGSELKVLLAICRITFGFHQDERRASLTQIQQFTGLSRQGVINAANSLENVHELIERNQDGGVTLWRVVVGLDKYTEQPKSEDNPCEAEGAVYVRQSCPVCHSTEQILQEHHIIPKEFGGKNTKSNYFYCCQQCHKAIHDEIRLQLKTKPPSDELFVSILEKTVSQLSRPDGQLSRPDGQLSRPDGQLSRPPSKKETRKKPKKEITKVSVEKPSTDEQPNLPPIKEKSSSQKTVSSARPKTQIKDKFIDLTGMSMPKVKNQQGYWWSQFGEILHIAKDDPGDACDALCQVVSYMQKEKLCISGPQSVVGLCRAVLAGQKLNGGTNEKTGRNSQSNGRPDGHSLGTIAFNPKTGETVHVG